MYPRLARLYHNMTLLYIRKGELTVALEILQQSLDIHQQYSDTYQMARVYNDMGLIYRTWGRYKEALRYYELALDCFEEHRDIEGIGLVSNNIGQIHYYHNDYPRAIDFFIKYLEVNRTIGKLRAVAGASNNIASAYMELEQYNLALDYYLKALNIYDSLGIELGVAIINDNIGTLYSKTGELNDALLYHFYALDIFKNLNVKPRISYALMNIGLVYYRLNNFERALEYLTQSKCIALEQNLTEVLLQLSLHLSDTYLSLDRPYESIEYYKYHVSIKDSLLKVETAERLSEIEKRYYYDNNSESSLFANKQIQKYQRLLYGLIIACIIMVVFLLLLLKKSAIRGRKVAEVDGKHDMLVSSISKIPICSTHEKYVLGYLGMSFFTIPDCLCNNNSCIRLIPAEDELIILTIHIGSELGVTEVEKRIALWGVEDMINSRRSNSNPREIIEKIYARFSSAHIETTIGADETHVKLGCLVINHAKRSLCYHGINPAWVIDRVGELHCLRQVNICLLYTSPSPRDRTRSRMPSSA